MNQELPRSAAGMLHHDGNVRHAILDAILPAAIDRPVHARRFVKPAQQLASLVGVHPNVRDELTIHRQRLALPRLRPNLLRIGYRRLPVKSWGDQQARAAGVSWIASSFRRSGPPITLVAAARQGL